MYHPRNHTAPPHESQFGCVPSDRLNLSSPLVVVAPSNSRARLLATLGTLSVPSTVRISAAIGVPQSSLPFSWSDLLPAIGSTAELGSGSIEALKCSSIVCPGGIELESADAVYRWATGESDNEIHAQRTQRIPSVIAVLLWRSGSSNSPSVFSL